MNTMEYSKLMKCDKQQLLLLAQNIQNQNEHFTYTKSNVKTKLLKWYGFPSSYDPHFIESRDLVPQRQLQAFDAGFEVGKRRANITSDAFSDDTTYVRQWMKMSEWSKKGYAYAIRQHQM